MSQPDILYVEDNVDHAELVLRGLERHQLRERIVHLEDGEQALAYLEQVSQGSVPRLRLVLLDLRLPRVDGMEVLKQIKASERLRDIPVIVFTTSSTSRDVNAAYALHANSYLVKPDDSVGLETVLAELSRYWLTHNLPAPARA
jgi:CheY-like chemotaxis protein